MMSKEIKLIPGKQYSTKELEDLGLVVIENDHREKGIKSKRAEAAYKSAIVGTLKDVESSLRIMSRGPHEIGSTDFDRSKLFFDNFGVPTLVKAVASGQVKYLFICDPIVVVDDKALHLQPVDFLKKRYTALKFVVNNFSEVHIPKSE